MTSTVFIVADWPRYLLGPVRIMRTMGKVVWGSPVNTQSDPFCSVMTKKLTRAGRSGDVVPTARRSRTQMTTTRITHQAQRPAAPQRRVCRQAVQQ